MTSLKWYIFRVTGPLWGESTGHRWIPLTKANDAELWCFVSCASEQTVEEKSRRRWSDTPWCSLWRFVMHSTLFPRGLQNMRLPNGSGFINTMGAWHLFQAGVVRFYNQSICYVKCEFLQVISWRKSKWCHQHLRSIEIVDFSDPNFWSFKTGNVWQDPWLSRRSSNNV